MGFGIFVSEHEDDIYINSGSGLKRVNGNTISLNKPTKLTGRVMTISPVNIYINGVLSNDLFTFKRMFDCIEFNYKNDITLFTKQIVIRLEIEKQ